jgi:hypothetical protein
MGGTCSMQGLDIDIYIYKNKRNAQKILVEKPEGKIPRVRPTRRCEGNVKMGN